MTHPDDFKYMDRPRRRKKIKPEKQTVLWTIYHSVLAIELGMIVVIEFIELMMTL
tara:strand:- start:171 stop:335 length:165 start_codon:yes stop_codon:yes gene_type:complete